MAETRTSGLDNFICNTNEDLDDGARWKLVRGFGSPEGVVAAGQGSIYLRKDGGANTTLYIKTGGGSGNTGWTAK